MKYLRPTKEELLAARKKTVPDLIGPDLKVLFCGINPGLYTAAIGHHFGRPGNRFWKALFEGGFTEKLLTPYEEKELLKIGYGITNLVPRTTLSASEIAKGEYISGGKILIKKLEKYKPKWIAFVGISAYRVAFGKRNAKIGNQNEKIANVKVWVLPNPSGLNANYTPRHFANLFSELKDAVS